MALQHAWPLLLLALAASGPGGGCRGQEDSAANITISAADLGLSANVEELQTLKFRLPESGVISTPAAGKVPAASIEVCGRAGQEALCPPPAAQRRERARAHCRARAQQQQQLQHRVAALACTSASLALPLPNPAAAAAAAAPRRR